MTSSPGRHEPAGIERPLLFGLGVIGFILFAAVAMAVLYALYLPYARQGPILHSDFGGPHLQERPAADLAELQRRQREILTVAHWRDREAGVATIPIDTAMKAVAARGDNAYAPIGTVAGTASSKEASQ